MKHWLLDSDSMGGLTRSIVVLALVSCASCASPPAPSLDEVLSRTESATRQAPYRLAVRWVEVEPGAAIRPPAIDAGWSPVPVDVDAVQEGVLAALHASRAFSESSILRLSEAEENADFRAQAGSSQDRIAFSVPPSRNDETVLAEAYQKKADIVLDLTVRKHNVVYEGRESDHLRFWEMAIDFLFAFPQWWIANELYGAEVELEARLVSVGNGESLWKKVYETGHVEAVRLSPFDRGIVWLWLDTFVIPERFSLENYALAGRHALPHAWNSVLAELADDLARQPYLAHESKLSKTLVLAIGVGEQEHRVPDLDVPNKDASRFMRALRDQKRIPDGHVIGLTGASATRAAILEALGELASRLNARDSLIVYYAGYGFSRADEAFLVPYDFNPARAIDTAVALGEIKRLLDPVRGTQAIVLDTSFGGEKQATRTLPLDLPGGTQENGNPRAAIEELATGRTVLLSARPQEAAPRESFDPEDKSGMFTARLLGAAKMDLDRNADGWLDMGEIFEQAKRDTEQFSSLVGRSQHPTRFGDPATIRFSRVGEETE